MAFPDLLVYEWGSFHTFLRCLCRVALWSSPPLGWSPGNGVAITGRKGAIASLPHLGPSPKPPIARRRESDEGTGRYGRLLLRRWPPRCSNSLTGSATRAGSLLWLTDSPPHPRRLALRPCAQGQWGYSHLVAERSPRGYRTRPRSSEYPYGHSPALGSWIRV